MDSELKSLREFIRKNTRYNKYTKRRWIELNTDKLNELNALIENLDKGDKQQ